MHLLVVVEIEMIGIVHCCLFEVVGIACLTFWGTFCVDVPNTFLSLIRLWADDYWNLAAVYTWGRDERTVALLWGVLLAMAMHLLAEYWLCVSFFGCGHSLLDRHGWCGELDDCWKVAGGQWLSTVSCQWFIIVVNFC